MASVLDQLTKKIEANGVGKIHEGVIQPTKFPKAKVIIEDPRLYKFFFNLDNKGGLAIEKSNKSFLVELKESLCNLYYITDESCLSISFNCVYQSIEDIKELPLSLIDYLRILCSKKAPLDISINENFFYITFEDSIVKDKEKIVTPKPKAKKGEKKEKEIGKKYTLEFSLTDISTLNLAVIDLVSRVITTNTKILVEDNFLPLPIDLSNGKEFLEISEYEVEIDEGKLRYVSTNNLLLNLVVCPVEVANNFLKKNEDFSSFQECDDISYEEDYSELNEKIDTFIGDNDE